MEYSELSIRRGARVPGTSLSLLLTVLLRPVFFREGNSAGPRRAVVSDSGGYRSPNRSDAEGAFVESHRGACVNAAGQRVIDGSQVASNDCRMIKITPNEMRRLRSVQPPLE